MQKAESLVDADSGLVMIGFYTWLWIVGITGLGLGSWFVGHIDALQLDKSLIQFNPYEGTWGAFQGAGATCIMGGLINLGVSVGCVVTMLRHGANDALVRRVMAVISALLALATLFFLITGCVTAVHARDLSRADRIIYKDLQQHFNKALRDGVGSKEYNKWMLYQHNNTCCGVDSFRDWYVMFRVNESQGAVPESCCKQVEAGCGQTGLDGDWFQAGCMDRHVAYLEPAQPRPLATGGFFLFIMNLVATVLFSWRLARRADLGGTATLDNNAYPPPPVT